MNFLGDYRRHCTIDKGGVSALKLIAWVQILVLPPSESLGNLTNILAC